MFLKEKLEKSGSFMITLLLLSVATGIGWVFRILHFSGDNFVDLLYFIGSSDSAFHERTCLRNYVIAYCDMCI